MIKVTPVSLLPTNSLELLKKYAELVVKYNAFFNLTGSKNAEDFLNEQIADCTCIYKEFEKYTGKTIYDIGSGVGLPGIALSLLLPNTKFVLVEKQKKRVNFLKTAVLYLGLNSRVSVLDSDANNIAHNLVDIITFRAVAGLGEIEKPIFNLLKNGGEVLAYLGPLGTSGVGDLKHNWSKIDCQGYNYNQKERSLLHLMK